MAVFVFGYQFRKFFLHILGDEADLFAFSEPEVRIFVHFPFIAHPLKFRYFVKG